MMVARSMTQTYESVEQRWTSVMRSSYTLLQVERSRLVSRLDIKQYEVMLDVRSLVRL